MPDEQNYLYGREGGTDKLVPQLLLDGNYVSYSSVPYSPGDEGHEGLFKTAPDGLYFYADGLWRKAPAYTYNWEDIDGGARFLPVDRDIALTDAERARLQNAVGLTPATPSRLGLVLGSGTLSSTEGNVQVDASGRMYVSPATATTAGVVLVTDLPASGTPVVATKDYVDSRVTSEGQHVPVATASSIGGVKASGDIAEVSVDGDVFIYRAEQEATDTSYTGTNYGLVRIAPKDFNPASEVYDDGSLPSGQQPYLVTVAQARSMASHYASTVTIDRGDYVATSSTIGFVMPGSGLSVTAGGRLDADSAVAYDPGDGTQAPTPSRRGTVKVHNGYDEVVGQDLSTVVPTVKSIRDWVEDKGYITTGGIPVADSTTLGGVKINGNGLSIDQQSGLLSVNFPQASTTAAGILQLDSSVTSSTGKAPTSGAVQAYVSAAIASATTPPAAPGVAGTVVVVSGGESPVSGAYSVPTVTWTTSTTGLLGTDAFKNAVAALIPEGGWEGGTVPNPSTFESTVQFQGITTVAGGAGGSYAATQVLNYSQIAALIAAGGGGGGTAGRRTVARDEMSYVTALTRLDVQSGWTRMGLSDVSSGQTAALQANVSQFQELVQGSGILTYNETADAGGPHLSLDGGAITFASREAEEPGGTDLPCAWAHVVTWVGDIITSDVTQLIDLRYVVRVMYDQGAEDQELVAAVYKVSEDNIVGSVYALAPMTADTNLVNIPSDVVAGLTGTDKLILLITRADNKPLDCHVTSILYRATVMSTGTGQVEVPWASYTPPAFDDPYGTVYIPNDLQVTGDVDCGDVDAVGNITAYGDIASLNGSVKAITLQARSITGYNSSGGTASSDLKLEAWNSIDIASPQVNFRRSSAGALDGAASVYVDGALTVAASTELQGSLTAATGQLAGVVFGAQAAPSVAGSKLSVKGMMHAVTAQFGGSNNADERSAFNDDGSLRVARRSPVTSVPFSLCADLQGNLYFNGHQLAVEIMYYRWRVLVYDIPYTYTKPTGAQLQAYFGEQGITATIAGPDQGEGSTICTYTIDLRDRMYAGALRNLLKAWHFDTEQPYEGMFNVYDFDVIGQVTTDR